MIIQSDSIQFEDPTGFLVLEGVNGAGKTSLQHRIISFAIERGYTTLATHEPGGTRLGVALRQLLLASEDQPCPIAEVFLFGADRAEHVRKVIIPALARHEVVVSDRFLYSTIAFQGYGHKMDRELIDMVNTAAVSNCHPDVVILLDLEPELGLKRTRARQLSLNAAQPDSFEHQELAFHRRLRAGFQEMAKTLPTPFLVVDATQSEELVWQRVEPLLVRWLGAIGA